MPDPSWRDKLDEAAEGGSSSYEDEGARWRGYSAPAGQTTGQSEGAVEAPSASPPPDWRYGYVPSSAPGLRKPGENYGEDLLTPMLQQYPGVNPAYLSEMFKVPTRLNPELWQDASGPGYSGKVVGSYYPDSGSIDIAPQAPNRQGWTLHEFGHALAPEGKRDSLSGAMGNTWGQPNAWGDFAGDFGESRYDVYTNPNYSYIMSPDFAYGNTSPSEAYAEIARLAGGNVERIPELLRRYYPWLR